MSSKVDDAFPRKRKADDTGLLKRTQTSVQTMLPCLLSRAPSAAAQGSVSATSTVPPQGPRQLRKHEWRIVQDCIWGPIRLHPLCNLIVDSPHFQRLRNLNQVLPGAVSRFEAADDCWIAAQLGCCNHVWPNAVHKRFEHSIGVYHLAGCLACLCAWYITPGLLYQRCCR